MIVFDGNVSNSNNTPKLAIHTYVQYTMYLYYRN